MKIIVATIVICIFFLIGCKSPQEDKPFNELKEIVKDEIELSLMNFDVKYAENPSKGIWHT